MNYTKRQLFFSLNMMNFIIILNRLIYILFILCIHSLKAQELSIKQIDDLQEKVSKMHWDVGNYKKGAALQKEVIEKSKKIKYKKGEIRGYIEFSNDCFGMSMYKQGFYFLRIAEQNLKHYNDSALKSRLYFVYGVGYANLGIHKQAIINFNKSFDLTFSIHDEALAERYKQNVYDWKRFSFEHLNLMDSVYSNEKKCMENPRPMLFIAIAERHLKKGRTDSAEYYIGKANNIVLASKAPFEGKGNVSRAYGELYLHKKEYEKSLKYLLASLKISQKLNFKNRELECYQLIYQVYRSKKDIENENKYLLKYSALNDSLNGIEKSIMDIPIEKLLQDEKEESTSNSNKNENILYYGIGFIVLIPLCIFIFMEVILKNKKKKIKNALHEKSKELDFIKRKVDENKEHLLYLATQNDPVFIIKFKELYDDFYTELLSEYPQLNINDMKFIAFVKLSFCNKDIASFTNVSVRTVESKKYRLRKKLNLDADVDFNEWIMNR